MVSPTSSAPEPSVSGTKKYITRSGIEIFGFDPALIEKKKKLASEFSIELN
jgi:hypothetical protein